MKITLDEKYNAKTDFTELGYVGETNARIITIEGYRCGGADSYKMRFKYPDDVVYDVDISGGTYTIEGSILRRVGAVYVQILAGHYVDGKYDYVKKSNTLTLHIGRSLKGDAAPVPTYEKSVEALEKVLETDKKLEATAEALNQAITAANTAKDDLQTAVDRTKDVIADVNAAADNATAAKLEVESAADKANKAKLNLFAAQKAAETALSNLNAAIDQADISDSNLTSTIDDAEAAKNQLSDVITTANNANDTLSEIILTATNLYTSLSAENETAVENIAKLAEENAKAGELYMKADGIVCNAEGKAITLNDSSDLGLSGLRIFGRSTQDGTPSPDNPVPIVSVGDSGKIELKIGNSGYCMRGSYFDNVQMIALKKGKSYRIHNGGSSKASIYNAFIFNENKSFGNSSALYNFGYNIKSLKNLVTDYNIYGECRLPSWMNNDYIITVDVDGLYFYQAVNTPNVNNDDFRMWELPSNYLDIPSEYQTLTLSTPNGLPGIPVTSGGNYTDENGQQWICDEIDLQRGVYVQRIDHIAEYVGQEITAQYMSTTSALTDGATIIYVLSEPIETQLTAEQIAAYKALHTNKPTTTITNSDNAHMAVSYTADTKAYIDNKFNELATAIIATGGDT